MGLEVDETEGLVEEHSQKLTTKELHELQSLQHRKILQHITSK